MLTPEVLIIASDKNEWAKAVIGYLKEKHPKIGVELIDTALFPQKLESRFIFNNDSVSLQLFSKDRQDTISLENVRTIWWCEPKPPEISATIQENEHFNFAYTECRQLLEGISYVVDCLWVNQPERMEIALNGLYQLQLARIAGFKVPDTIVTNSPGIALDFWKKHQGQVVYRQLIPFPTFEDLTQESLQHIGNLEFAPLMFHEIIDCKIFFTIVVIGNGIYGVKQENKQENEGPSTIKKCEEKDITRDLELKILKLVKEAGLVYTQVTIGFIDPSNYIFVSMDPCEPFLEVERQTHLPLTEVFAQLLTSGKVYHSQCVWPTLSGDSKGKGSITRTNLPKQE